MDRAFWVFPRGYAGALAPLFAPLLQWRLARARGAIASTGEPWVIVSYPWLHRAVRGVRGERLVYYNLDDYSLYQPERVAAVRKQENELLGRATLTICLSQQQVMNLRARLPVERAESVQHFPLGVVESYLNPQSQHPIGVRTVGYVGNLIDRVDWRLVAETATALPDVDFIFVGSLADGVSGLRPDWETERATALALRNVRHVGAVRQEDVPQHYWRFAVNWIPYVTDHPFNRAACPTKIMDGLASGRPVLGTDLPELRLYPEWITLVHSAEDAVRSIREHFEGVVADPERASRQVAFARQHTWAHRANALVKRLNEVA